MAGGVSPPISVILTWPAANYVNPVKRGHGILIMSCILGPLAYSMVGARIWVRAYMQKKAGLDDWLMLAAMVRALYKQARYSILIGLVLL